MELVARRRDTEDDEARVRQYFGTLETLDADAIASFLAHSARVRLTGMYPMSGRAEIRRALIRFLAGVDGIRHEPVMLWMDRGVCVMEADIIIQKTSDRAAIRIPVTHVLRWKNGLIEDCQIRFYLEARTAMALPAVTPRHSRAAQGEAS